MMKKVNHIVYTILLMLFLTGCDLTTDVENETLGDDEIAFTSISTRGTLRSTEDQYRNMQDVPDTVGVFLKKTSSFVMRNAIFRKTNYESNNYLDSNGLVVTKEVGDPTPSGDQLFWYKTAHSAAYWDKSPGVIYDFYAYAPAVETNGVNGNYKVSDNGIVSFKIDEKIGVPVDFICSRSLGCTVNKADSLHLPFRHMLSKMVFKMKNETKNAVTCYGVRYKLKYPEATFDLTTGNWAFSGSTTQVDVKRYAQYEIFSDSEVSLPELTTLLFPVNSAQITGPVPTGVIVSFQVCLNNKWYDMTMPLENFGLSYTEGKLIELTFNCTLNYGSKDDEDVLWNIFVATFDSFEDGGTIDGKLN